MFAQLISKVIKEDSALMNVFKHYEFLYKLWILKNAHLIKTEQLSWTLEEILQYFEKKI